MDPRLLRGPLFQEYYEFLDFTDIDEDEIQQLKETLYSTSPQDFLQLPWVHPREEWRKESYGDEGRQLANGPLDPICDSGGGMPPGQSPGAPPVAQLVPAVTLYSQPPPPYTMPSPSPGGYQHPQNVFVSNVTNVHGYVAGHYVQPHYPMPEGGDMGRGHRGRSRGRGNKRPDGRMDPVETSSAPGFPQTFVPIHYHHPAAAYYTQPLQLPNAQHATGSPLYLAPVYTHVYGAYHPHGAHQYYTPAGSAHPMMEDTTEMADLVLDNPPDEPAMYQQQNDEDYENVVTTTVIVNSNIDPINCDIKSDNANTGFVIPDNKPIISSVETFKTEQPSNITKTFVEKCNITDTVPSDVVTKTLDPVPVNNKFPQESEVIVDNSVNIKLEPQELVPVANTGKSWASLFNKSSSPAQQITVQQNVDIKTTPNQKVQNLVQKNDEKQVEKPEIRSVNTNLSIYSNDPVSHRMGEFISKYNLDNRTVSLQPRGLTNRSNYCYINSILQALLACPLFYNLLKALPHQPRKGPNAKTPTPIIDSMVEFVNEFTPLSAESRLNRKEKGQRKDIDVICGTAFEPTRIYKILNGIRTDTFIVEGRQEDAEEFFGCLLNGLNDEMLELSKLVDVPNHQTLSNGDIATNGDPHEQDDVEWTVMGPKNKGSITRRADFGRTPISDIFRGQLRSRVHRTGDQITDNVQPFFTLQLDIEKPSSVYEALELLVNKDKLEGVTCSKTNQQVEAWQQVTIEELPLVMVLHLKCFNYKLDACSKIIKALEFPIDLKIDTKLLSSKVKYTVKQKQYKLFAVVYHDGKEATKGHYLTDAYHVGYGGWVRYDDSTVKSVQESHVLHPNAARVPYLLYYRRCDTIGNQQNAKKD